MDTILSQRTMPWGNEFIGTSKFYIHAYGSALTELAEIMNLTPSEVNEKLKAVEGFGPGQDGELCEIIWQKVFTAFPEYTAQFITPYDNNQVLEALAAGRFILTLVDGAPNGNPGITQFVRYIGDAKCHDPFTGTERPTADFPDVKGIVIITHVPLPAGVVMPEQATETVKAEVVPTPDQQAQDPTIAVTLANLPAHEKQAVISIFEKALEDVKKILAV